MGSEMCIRDRGIAAVLAPLHALVATVPRPKDALLWDDTCDASFSAAKNSLADSVQLAHPDPNAAVTLTTDASDLAVGAVLAQGPLQKPLGFFLQETIVC